MIYNGLGFTIGLAVLTSAHADTKTDLATCKMESMRVGDALSLAYVRNCAGIRKSDPAMTNIQTLKAVSRSISMPVSSFYCIG